MTTYLTQAKFIWHDTDTWHFILARVDIFFQWLEYLHFFYESASHVQDIQEITFVIIFLCFVIMKLELKRAFPPGYNESS